MMRSGQAQKEIPYIENDFENQAVKSTVIKLNIDNQPIIVKLELHSGYRPENSWYLRKKLTALWQKKRFVPATQKSAKQVSFVHNRYHWNHRALKRSLLFVTLYILFLYACNLGLIDMGL